MKRLLIYIIISILNVALLNSQNVDEEEIFDMSLEEMMKVKVVTASKKSEEISNIPASVVVISRDEIEQLGYKSYTEILNHITGFYMINDAQYLGHKNFGVRGFYSPGAFANVVILVNGVTQMSDEYLDYPDTKITVPVSSIDRIEVIRGPMSVMYGNGAFFGAINIITNEKDRSFACIEGGNYNTRTAFMRLSDKNSDFQYVMNVGYNSDDGIDVPFTDMTSDIELIKYGGLDENSTTKGLLEKSSKYFGLNVKKDDFYTDISYNESITDIVDGLPSYGEGSEITHFATNIAFGYYKEFSENFNLKSQAGYYVHTHYLDYEKFYDNFYELDAAKSRAYDFDIITNYRVLNNMNLLAGFYYRQVLEMYQIADFPASTLSRGDGEIKIPRDDNMTTTSLYAQLNYEPIQNFNIIGGVRIEHLSPYIISYQRGVVTNDTSAGLLPENKVIINQEVKPPNNGYAVTPSLALIYKLNEKNVIKLMYGQAIKQPAFLENLRQIIQSRPTLTVQKIKTFEINYLLSLNKKINYNFSGFYNNLNDLITSEIDFDPDEGWKYYSANSGQFETYGIEASIKYFLGDKFSLFLSILYQKTKNLKEGYENIKPGYSPTVLSDFHCNYNITKNMSMALIAKYTGKMESEWVTNTIPEAGSRIGDQINRFVVIDLNFRYKNVFYDHVCLSVNVKNLLDQEIRYPTTTLNQWLDKGFLGYGRRFYVKLGYEFN